MQGGIDLRYFKPTLEQSKRIQILRGIAIIVVVINHTIPAGIWKAWLTPFADFGVGLFLFLSGLLSSAKNWHPAKRILKVGIPYVIWTIIYQVIGNIHRPSAIPKECITGLLFGNSNVAMYFIPVYLEFVLLIPLIDKLAHSRLKYLGFIITPVSIIILRYLPLYFGVKFHKYIGYIDSISCLEWFTYFYLGYLIGNNIIHFDVPLKKLALFFGGGYSAANCRRLPAVFHRSGKLRYTA